MTVSKDFPLASSWCTPFLVAEQLYTHFCVFVCLFSVFAMKYLSKNWFYYKVYSVQNNCPVDSKTKCSAVRCRVMQHTCIYTVHCTAELQKQSIPLSWIVVPTDPGEDN